MPSIKQGGGYTLTFSKKNQDVKQLLENKQKENKQNNKTFKVTDYICECIRFYEQNKDLVNKEDNKENINIDIEELINKKLVEMLNTKTFQELLNTKDTEENENKHLEEDLENIDIEED